MTIGVTLNDKHCFDDYGMWLTDVDISQPEVQTHYVQVPGRNGELDLTEALTGDVRYYNGTITMTFQTAENVCNRTWFDQMELVKDDLHGKRATFIFDGSNIEYSARCEVSGTPTAGGIYEITVEATVDEAGELPAFAFYSADDSSLNFHIGHLPTAGGKYNGKTVTALYDSVESTGSSNPPWYSYRTSVKTVYIDSSFQAASPTSCYYWFYNFTACTEISGLENLDTSAVTRMDYMFYGCQLLTALDLSAFDTAKVTRMNYMFAMCLGLTSLDVSGLDTAKVTSMSSMFYGCSALVTIYSDDNMFVTTAVTSGGSMFSNCSSLVGGNGTKYSSSNITYTYAHIDIASNPGYFTQR